MNRDRGAGVGVPYHLRHLGHLGARHLSSLRATRQHKTVYKSTFESVMQIIGASGASGAGLLIEGGRGGVGRRIVHESMQGSIAHAGQHSPRSWVRAIEPAAVRNRNFRLLQEAI